MLTMVGIGVADDGQPTPDVPPLRPGVHLRWGFESEHGFPTHGFTLLRRPHEADRSRVRSLADELVGRSPGRVAVPLVLGAIQIDGGDPLDLVDTLRLDRQGGTLHEGPDGTVEIGLQDQRSVEVTLPGPAYWVEVTVGVFSNETVAVTAKQWGRPVARGDARAGGPFVRFEHDAITSVVVAGGDAALAEVRFRLVRPTAHEGWELVPGGPVSLRLPVSHPAYPGTGPEDLDRSRQEAMSRLRYAPPPDFEAPPQVRERGGSTNVRNGALVVEGVGTQWTTGLVGGVLRIAGRGEGYLVTDVPDADRLVLSRPYEGGTSAQAPYSVSRDEFGVLHDHLVHLVRGGSTPMAARALPLTVYHDGTADTEAGAHQVTGVGTQWGPDLKSLTFRAAIHDQGLVGSVESAGEGARVVGAGGTGWHEGLVGLLFQFFGEPGFYTVIGVDEGTQALHLDRPRPTDPSGPPPGGGAYTIYESLGYGVREVVSPGELRLDRPYAGPGRGRRYVITGQLGPSEPGPFQPQLSAVLPLHLVLAAAVHPALAQAVGLYWVDDTRETVQRKHDYLILRNDSRDLLDAIRKFDRDPDRLQSAISSVLEGLASPRRGPNEIVGYIVFGKQRETPPPVPPPTEAVAFPLDTDPLGAPHAPVRDTRHSVGLRWSQSEAFDGVLRPDRSVRYHAYRHHYPGLEPTDPPPAQAPSAQHFEWITEGRAVLPNTRTTLPAGALRLSGWPPTPLDFLDIGLSEGWYSYRLRGVDLFGRFSHFSPPARWWDAERWPDAGGLLHEFAVRVLDRTPPPPPLAVEAVALDPGDPLVTKDAPYRQWRAAHPGAHGLRVSWVWTEQNARQAPDTERFRLHFSSGRQNAVTGWVTAVTPSSDTKCSVTFVLDGALDEPSATDAYAGTRLQAGGHAFTVAGSAAALTDATALLLTLMVPPAIHAVGRLRADGSRRVVGLDAGWHRGLEGLLMNVPGAGGARVVVDVLSPAAMDLDQALTGTGDHAYAVHRIPLPRQAATLEIPGPGSDGAPTHALWTDFRDPDAWSAAAWLPSARPEIGVDDFASAALEIRKDPGGREMIGHGSVLRGQTAELFVDGARSAPADLRRVRPGVDVVRFDEDPDGTFVPVLSVERPPGTPSAVPSTIQVPALPPGVATSAWRIGRPARRYELFLDAPATGLDVSRQAPVAFAHVGVTALDHRDNESTMGGPAKVYRVLRVPPAPPALPPLEDEVLFASPADFYGDSYFSFRWPRPDPALRTHVFRALDDALFRYDWSVRSTRGHLDPQSPEHRRARLFEGLADPTALAREVNGVTDQTTVADLSDGAWRLLARLPGNAGVLSDDDLLGRSALSAPEVEKKKRALLARDQRIRHARTALDPDAGSAEASLFPDPAAEPRWAPGAPTSAGQRRRDGVAAALNSLPATPGYDRAPYQALGPDAQRVLAGLPGNEDAFTRLTAQALDADDPALSNARGPDDPDAFALGDPADPLANPGLLRYIDRLDGRTRSRYFYRAALVDGAQNESALGLATPPVATPDVVPPRCPVVTKAVAGHPDPAVDGAGAITLQWVRGRDADLDHYRVYRTSEADRARDVRLMDLAADGVSPGTERSVTWTDEGLDADPVWRYRVVAVDTEGHPSQASDVAAAQAFPQFLPPVPSLDVVRRSADPSSVRARWSTPHASLLEHRPADAATWAPGTGWLQPGSHEVDAPADADRAWAFRLRVRGDANAVRTGPPHTADPA